MLLIVRVFLKMSHRPCYGWLLLYPFNGSNAYVANCEEISGVDSL